MRSHQDPIRFVQIIISISWIPQYFLNFGIVLLSIELLRFLEYFGFLRSHRYNYKHYHVFMIISTWFIAVEMGNSSSTDVGKMSESEEGYFLLNEALDNMSTNSVEEVAAHLLRLELNSEDKFLILSKKIHLRAIEDNHYCSKYVKLAKIISNVACQQIETRREITFKDIFVNHSIQQFGTIRTSSESRFDLARFYGHLFVEGLVSSTLISYWIHSLNNQKDLQHQILDTIKDKVVIESRVYPEDQYLRALKTKLLESKIIQVDSPALERAYAMRAI